ncbi:MAG: S8 family serine peptidase [candidate division Zixibacteria bacterium]|nr:S8 family serine peptidase [candidate division Zixibacteria bacterium]MDH3937228.1 S8 family serine peptidase [candidate division Zixibacteria bacterium]MDH4034078.1 S8 family serine peptidase [candidate division Zixibacteria bacterium]
MASVKPSSAKADGSEVRFEVVVKPEGESRSVFDPDAFPTIANLDEFRSPKGRSIKAARKLQKNDITVHHIGEFSISASCPEAKFESFFGTKISQHRPPKKALAPADYVMRAPKKGEDWKLPTEDNLDKLIEKAYIQHDPILFAGERPIPPFWKDKFRLRVPVDVAQIMKASSVHKKGITGDGVRVVMPDTGFYHHPYFKEQGYNFLAVTTPDVIDYTSDASGHGTGECANLLATAPGINFIGLKKGNTTLAIKTAVELRADIITCSWGYSEDLPGTSMPSWLKPLYLAVLDAVSKGITVCFSAGNGHFGFPGSMPEVISVGGVVVDEKLNYSATRYTSGFESTWFPGRDVPDISGLCGAPPSADYIVLPVQKGCSLEKAGGWGAFSGTSAASPMVAGVCALLKEADPTLTPNDIKNILKYTARDITVGKNSMNKSAVPGPDLATGYGLVDAERAMETVL